MTLWRNELDEEIEDVLKLLDTKAQISEATHFWLHRMKTCERCSRYIKDSL